MEKTFTFTGYRTAGGKVQIVEKIKVATSEQEKMAVSQIMLAIAQTGMLNKDEDETNTWVLIPIHEFYRIECEISSIVVPGLVTL